MEGWSLFFNVLTGLSTFAMAIAAFMALNAWKNQQKRSKLVNLLEEINKYVQDLQIYELESTVFAKQTTENNQKDLYNTKLVLEQRALIDEELARGFGNCILLLKNWLIEDEKQYEKLNAINKKLQEYRIKIFEYVELKIKMYSENKNPENILYGIDENLLKEVCEKKKQFEPIRNKLQNLIDSFKKDYRKLLK